jgi:dUTP pyrophosphatase
MGNDHYGKGEVKMIKVKLLDKRAKVPTYATDGAACFDFYTTSSGYVPARGKKVASTGLSFSIPRGKVLEIYSLSEHGFKNSVRLGNCVGIIDSDYQGELMILLRNDSDKEFRYERGERIAQGKLCDVVREEFMVVDDLDTPDLGDSEPCPSAGCDQIMLENKMKQERAEFEAWAEQRGMELHKVTPEEAQRLRSAECGRGEFSGPASSAPNVTALVKALKSAIEFCENPANRRRQTLLQQCHLLDRLRADLLEAMQLQDREDANRRATWAGVTVWIGDKQRSYGFTREVMELSNFDALQVAFDNARRIDGGEE